MRMKKPMRPKKPARATSTVAVRTLVVAGIGVMGAAMLIAARQPAPIAGAAAGSLQPEKAGAVDAFARKAAASKAPAPVAAVSAVDAKTGKASAAKHAPVTITGCLEKDDNTFKPEKRSISWSSFKLKIVSKNLEKIFHPDNFP